MNLQTMHIPSAKTLEQECFVAKFQGRNYDDRVKRIVKACHQVRLINEKQSIIKELPFGLFDINAKRMNQKVVMMSREEAQARNRTIKDLGLFWNRIGY